MSSSSRAAGARANRKDPLDRAISLALAGRLDAAARALETLPPSPLARWAAAYVACATGDLSAAERIAGPLARVRDPEIRARAAITLASALRQRGRHARARVHDRRALDAAGSAAGRVSRELRAHALISLAADAVGLGDASRCARILRAAAAAAPRGDWRVAVRLGWVRAEHALLRERPREAVAHARRALERSRRTGAARHEAKSLLFLGASLQAAGEAGARPALRRAGALARRTRARAIAAVAEDLLSRR